MALEFVGDGAAALRIDERLAVSNMAVEAGADTGLFPADDVTADYLDGRTDRPWTAERTDDDAEVAAARPDRPRGLPPLLALPHSPGNVVPVERRVGRKIDQVYIGNCANGTMTDLRQAAEILARPQACTETAARSSSPPRRRSTGRRSPRGCSTRSSRRAAS